MSKSNSLKVCHSSASDEWESPPEFVAKVCAKYLNGPFGLDAAATPANALAEKYFTIEDDALQQDWNGHGPVWLNPPYSKLKPFMKKCAESEAYIWTLIPARTDTKAWQDYIFPFAAHIWFIRGRMKFRKDGETLGPAPFPSALVNFSPSFIGEPIVDTMDQ